MVCWCLCVSGPRLSRRLRDAIAENVCCCGGKAGDFSGLDACAARRDWCERTHACASRCGRVRWFSMCATAEQCHNILCVVYTLFVFVSRARQQAVQCVRCRRCISANACVRSLCVHQRQKPRRIFENFETRARDIYHTLPSTHAHNSNSIYILVARAVNLNSTWNVPCAFESMTINDDAACDSCACVDRMQMGQTCVAPSAWSFVVMCAVDQALRADFSEIDTSNSDGSASTTHWHFIWMRGRSRVDVYVPRLCGKFFEHRFVKRPARLLVCVCVCARDPATNRDV